jgi:hypothetical protein
MKYSEETIAICIPAQDVHPMKFTLALAAQCMELGRDGFGKVAIIPGHSSVGAFRARNKIIKILEGIEKEKDWAFDWTFWVDSDMLFPSRSYQAMRRHNKDIVAATYRRRSAPYELLGKPKEGTSGTVSVGDLAPADRLPTGVMLIRRSVFSALEKPYWRVDLGAEGVDDTVGEDSLFCDAAIAAGYEVWLDTVLTSMCKHIATIELEPDVEKAGPQIIVPPGLIAA